MGNEQHDCWFNCWTSLHSTPEQARGWGFAKSLLVQLFDVAGTQAWTGRLDYRSNRSMKGEVIRVLEVQLIGRDPTQPLNNNRLFAPYR